MLFFLVRQAGVTLNSLTSDKYLDLSKLKAFADDKITLREKLKFVLESMEKIAGKGQNAGNHNLFKRLLSQGR